MSKGHQSLFRWKSRDVKRDNSERFFSSAARPRASAPRSVSVVAGKQHPLKARSSLASALLFQPPDSNLVAATAFVQGLRQGPEVGWSLWEVNRNNSVHFIPNWEHDSQVLVHLLSKSKMLIKNKNSGLDTRFKVLTHLLFWDRQSGRLPAVVAAQSS